MTGVYPPGLEVHRHADISADGLHRYTLHRWWDSGRGPRLTFVMLNPSTADAEQDDPTIRRCVSFTRSLGGFGGIRVLNLYAYRATSPADLWRAAADGVDITGGPRNDDLLREVAHPGCRGETIIAAWGAHARRDRVDQVLAMPGWDRALALGVTKAGAPRHPLYLPATAQPAPWPGSRDHA